MTSRDNTIYYTITAVVFVGIVLISLLFHNTGQPTNGDSETGVMTEIISTIVIAAAAVVTATATVILARITSRYAETTDKILRAANKPEVILFLRMNRALSTMLCVQNIGAGYASDIKFTGDLSFKPTVPGDSPLEETEPFKSGLNYLGSGHKIDVFLFTLKHLPTVPEHSFSIIVSYKDSTNIPYETTFRFDIGNWMSNPRQFIRPETNDIEGVLDEINKTLRKIEDKVPTRE